jgi:hypothetical protein
MKILETEELNTKEIKSIVKKEIEDHINNLPMLALGADNDVVLLKLNDLSITFGHYTYSLNPDDIPHFPEFSKERSVRFIILQGDHAIASITLKNKNNTWKLAYFSSGPSIDLFINHIHMIEHYPKFRNVLFELEYLKIPFLSINVIKLHSAYKTLYLIPHKTHTDQDGFMDEKKFCTFLQRLFRDYQKRK